ncbi:MAG: isocitrate/isopropylmalate dehydrogenase family protein [Candidatus Thorarchaeota archaeon]|nr:isocitrate/isopropylmalate dehydrogenase family protein [Candidatus Thorarchaeota archaeon]
MGNNFKVAVLPGDGIGREVVPQALRVIQTAEELGSGFSLDVHEFECGGEYYRKTRREWSEEAEEFTKKEADVVLLGAVGANNEDGSPVRRQDGHLAGYSVVIGLRFELDLYANLRPVKLYEGVPTPLANRTHEDIDMIMVRENTEGLYAPQDNPSRSVGAEEVVDLRKITKKGSMRVCRFAFEKAATRDGAPADKQKRVTCVDKSNLLAGCQLFRHSFNEVAKLFPGISLDYAYVDAFTQWIIRNPCHYDVVVAPNAFGDIITDLGAAIQGGLGLAPAGSIGDNHAVFEPVHGSAPKYANQGVSNPIASILSGAMLLDWLGSTKNNLGCKAASTLIEESVADVLREGRFRTYDLCRDEWDNVDPSSTVEVTNDIIRKMKDVGDNA